MERQTPAETAQIPSSSATLQLPPLGMRQPQHQPPISNGAAAAAAVIQWENVNQNSIIGLDDNNKTGKVQVPPSVLLDDGDDDDESQLVVGDLSCLKNGFHPAPRVLNADIKYLR